MDNKVNFILNSNTKYHGEKNPRMLLRVNGCFIIIYKLDQKQMIRTERVT